MRKRVMAFVLVLAMAISTFAGLCMVSAVAQTNEKINLLENYRLNPHFSDDEMYSGTQPYMQSGSTFTLASVADAPDGDGVCGLMTKRTELYSARVDLIELMSAQGNGAKYEGSFFVKTNSADQTVKVYASLLLLYGRPHSTENVAAGTSATGGSISAWYTDAQGQKVTISKAAPVTVGNEWVEIHFTTGAVALTKNNLNLNKVYIYFTEEGPQTYTDATDGKTYYTGDICIDNFSLYRTDSDPVLSGYAEEFDVKTTDNSTLRRYKKTAIGAIYYNNWYSTPTNYNYWERYNSQTNENGEVGTLTNSDNSTQEARSLSPSKYHYIAPFWSDIVSDGIADVEILKNSNLEDKTVTDHIIFEYDENTWKQEMAYAAWAGIDYMAYLASTKAQNSGEPLRYHVANEGKVFYNESNGLYDENGTEATVKMCVMFQEAISQDIALYLTAMKKDYYYKIDGKPVVYFFDTGINTAEEIEAVKNEIEYVRKKAALAGINDIYVIQTGADASAESLVSGNDASTADAISWYTFDASVSDADITTATTSIQTKQAKIEEYKNKTLGSVIYASQIKTLESEIATLESNLATYQYKRSYQGYHEDNLIDMETVSSNSNVTSAASIVPTFSLGRNQQTRINVPCTWITPWGSPSLPYGGRYTDDPTADEITQGLLDVLNFNKKNYAKFKANSVLMFAWNEFTEGGWICPTLNVDDDGKIIDKNQPNTMHLEAVKRAIEIYRDSEKYTLLTTDVNGTLTDSSGTTVAQGSAEYMLSPEKATVESKTPYSITLKEQEGCQYSIDNVTYQASNTFTGLTPGQSYTFYVKATANSYEYFEGGNSSAESDTVQTYSTIQTAPVIESVTAATITVAKEDWEGYEYSLDNVTYQASNVFTGLNPSTSYTVYARVPGTTTALSVSVTTKTKTTPAAPSAPSVKAYSQTSVTLEAKTGYEYSLNGNTWVSTNEFVNLTPGTTYSFYQRIAETAEENASPASEKTTVTLSKNTVTMQAEPVAQQVDYNSITLVAIEGAEYSKDGENWQTSNEFTGLQEGTTYTFYQRFKETATTDASNITQAQIQTKLGHLITINVDTTGEIDFEQLSTITVNGNTLDVTFVDGKASFIISRDALVSLSFVADVEYKPVSIRNAGTKGAALGIDSYTFIAYGNRSDYVVKYVLTEDTTIVNMFYTNAAGEKVMFDSFIAESDLNLKLQNYPQLYNKTFKKYIVDGNEISTANEVVQLIETQYGTEVDVEVVYSDNAATIVSGYSIAQYANMEVTVEDQPVQGNVAPLSLVTFTASETAAEGAFSYWADAEGNAVSYNRVYTRYITGNVDIHPVYGAEVQQAAITVKVADIDGKLVLIAERSLKSGLDILEHGIIIAEYETDELSLDDVGENAKGKVYLGRRVDNNGSVLNNGTYILTKGDKHSLGGTYSEMGTTLSFVAYVRYKDANGQEQIVKTKVQHSKVNAVEPGPSLDFDEID